MSLESTIAPTVRAYPLVFVILRPIVWSLSQPLVFSSLVLSFLSPSTGVSLNSSSYPNPVAPLAI